MYLCLHLCMYIYIYSYFPAFLIQPLWFSKTLRVGAVLTNWMSWPTCRAFPAYCSSGRRPLLLENHNSRKIHILNPKVEVWKMIFHFNWVDSHVPCKFSRGCRFDFGSLETYSFAECVLGGTHLGGQCGRWILCTYVYIYLHYMSYASFGMLAWWRVDRYRDGKLWQKKRKEPYIPIYLHSCVFGTWWAMKGNHCWNMKEKDAEVLDETITDGTWKKCRLTTRNLLFLGKKLNGFAGVSFLFPYMLVHLYHKSKANVGDKKTYIWSISFRFTWTF